MTDADGVTAGIEQIGARWAPPDTLVNKAGIRCRGPSADFLATDWNDIMAGDLSSVFLVGQAVRVGWSTGVVARS